MKKLLMKLTRILSRILLTILLLFTMVVSAKAEGTKDKNEAMRWTNLSSINVDIVFNNGEGSANGLAIKKNTAESVEGTLDLYQYVNGSWILIDSKTQSTTRNSLGMSIDFPAISGTKYKAVFSVTAYSSGFSESASLVSTKTCS